MCFVFWAYIPFQFHFPSFFLKLVCKLIYFLCTCYLLIFISINKMLFCNELEVGRTDHRYFERHSSDYAASKNI